MSIQVKLHIEDQIINILEHQLTINQNADYSGKPSSKPTGEPIELTYISLKNDPFIDKLVSGKLIDSLKLIFSSVQMNGKSTTIELLDLYVLGHHENYNGFNNIPITSSVKLSFATFIAEGQVMDVKYWKVTDPFQNTQVTASNFSEENEDEEKEFNISIKHIKSKDSFVPLGIPAYNGTKENKTLDFEIEVQQNEIESYKIEILHDDNVIFTVNSGEEELPQTFDVGKHTFKWDGFDSNGIYDSKSFIKGTLKAKITGRLEGSTKTAESDEISFKRKEVDWVDTIINKNTKRIDITLRVNLRDGGEKGTEEDCHTVGSGNYSPVRKVCPWDDIPKNELTYGTPIKTRTKSFKDLEKLALEGLNYHWGRNKNHFVAKNVEINNELYEVYINAINSNNKAMDDVSLIFNTNNKWMRSGNPGTVEDPISLIGNIVSREAICYNVGYIKYSNGWGYKSEINEDVELKDTSAHEIGHTILKAYGGTFYSYGHKGSVNTVTQNLKSSAPKIPLEGEIDIMPYYNDNIFGNEYYQKDYHKRRVASTKDLLSLIWLTKINIK